MKMKGKWSRRQFLEAGIKGSMIVGSGSVAGLTSATAESNKGKAAPSTHGVDAEQRRLLQTAMDEIIPAGDGMPAASEVGGVEYLDRLARKNAEIKNDLARSLTALDELSRKEFGKEFPALASTERIDALKKLEGQFAPELFSNLRDYVYEAYYIQPNVWKLIGYDFYPTNQHGPHMKAFDEAILAEVRKRPKLYREVP